MSPIVWNGKLAKHALDLGAAILESSGFSDSKWCGARIRCSSNT